MASIATRPTPAHVPDDLVRSFRYDMLPGVEINSVQAAADAARRQPDVFWGPEARHGKGAWVITRHDLIREVYQDPELFSSRNNAGFSKMAGEDWPLLPLEADPPSHAAWRMLLNPIFAPARIKALEVDIEALARRLVDRVLAKGEAEFVSDFATVFPSEIFLNLLDLPLEHVGLFLEWERKLAHGDTKARRQEGARGVVAYLRNVVAERRSNPKDDLISHVANAWIDGRESTPDEALSVACMLYVAGLDTVANMLGWMFKHLAEHPQDQQRLREDPALIPVALEELLRAYPIVITGRQVTRDVEFHGVKMKKGDTVSLATVLAGRDDREFPNPDVIDFNREKVSHITFGSGPHRCVGSHLARRELRIALEEWLRRVPPFRVKPGERPVTQGRGVFGVEKLHLVW